MNIWLADIQLARDMHMIVYNGVLKYVLLLQAWLVVDHKSWIGHKKDNIPPNEKNITNSDIFQHKIKYVM